MAIRACYLFYWITVLLYWIMCHTVGQNILLTYIFLSIYCALIWSELGVAHQGVLVDWFAWYQLGELGDVEYFGGDLNLWLSDRKSLLALHDWNDRSVDCQSTEYSWCLSLMPQECTGIFIELVFGRSGIGFRISDDVAERTKIRSSQLPIAFGGRNSRPTKGGWYSLNSTHVFEVVCDFKFNYLIITYMTNGGINQCSW